MASFSFPGRNNASTRPGPQRAHSSGSRVASPYQRPTSTASPSSTPSDKWQHDLFGTESNLYQPSINTNYLKTKVPGWQDEPSASLRPFGSATPAAQPLHSAPQPVQQQQQQQRPAAVSTNSAPSLQNRLGIKGVSDAALQQKRAQEARQKADREYQELVKQRKEEERLREEKVAIAVEEDKGFVVQVEGLVQGTSAEDVQTAFGSYGDISFCFIVDPTSANLIARLTFVKHSDAAEACSKLDGAIADGRPLRVKQSARTPVPPALAPLPPRAAVVNGGGTPTGPRGGNVPKGPRGAARQPPVVVPAPAPAPAPSKMYADEIEAAQTAAFSSMDVDMEAPTAVVTTAPRGGAGVRGGRGGGRGGRAVAAPARIPAARPGPPPSLAARLSGGPAIVPTGPASQRQPAQQQQKPVAQPSLLARFGVAGANGAGAAVPGATGGKGKKGRGGKGGQSAAPASNSLLARIV